MKINCPFLEKVIVEVAFTRIELTGAKRKVMDWGGTEIITCQTNVLQEDSTHDLGRNAHQALVLNSAKFSALFLRSSLHDPDYFLMLVNISQMTAVH